MRKLVTIREIAELNPIPDADNIEVATVDGWEVVVKRGEFDVGDYGVYFEIDSGLPVYDSRYSFLLKNGTKNFFGKEVFRIKTIKLRKQISQGLILPLQNFPEILNYLSLNKITINTAVDESIDFSEMLDVVKYEPPAPSAPNAAGTFPSFISRTDAERCVSKGTLVSTDKGNIPIEVIVDSPNDYMILSFNHESLTCEYKKILDGVINPKTKDKWLKIRMKSGKEILVTKNHKIFDASKCAYTNASNLTVGDFVISM